MPAPSLADASRRTAHGRLKMLLVLLICAAPVVASYVTYFVIRPTGRTNYSELVQPMKPLPDDLPLLNLKGEGVLPQTLRGQWLLIVVAGGACDAECEKNLWLQRQLRETLGKEKDRLDKVWFINDDAVPRPETLQAIGTVAPATVLRAGANALSAWLQPAPGHTLVQHLYIVDPMGNWMMRVPADPEPAKLKRDLERLMRASASWDEPGR
ncbi:MAG TPA: hypothetical protein VE029_04920 [Rhizobacter sp.]|nr:hypothetical protein [Rhizobacter sp.]